MQKSFIVRITSVLAIAVFLSSSMVSVFAFDGGQQAIDNKQAQIDQIINSAERHYVKGEEAYKGSQYDFARNEFDQAVDTIFIASIDVRSDDRLRIYYRQLVEKINRYQIDSLDQKGGGFSEQRYEPSPLDKLASLSDTDLDEVVATDIDVSDTKYNFQFSTAYPVLQFISYFTKGRGRATMAAGLQRSVQYRELATRIFKEEGVPTDIIWLAQVESSWNPYASSWAGAKGIWQFMPATGSRFGLARNYWVDDRSHPEKSTRAAAQYLKWLATRYRGDWSLALAAYNTGEGNVDAAIARSGSRDFWRLHSSGYMAQETRNYVPAILAVITIAKNPAKYGFQMPPAFSSKYATQTIAKQTDLRPLAKKLNVSYSALLDLNPELQHGVTPPGKHIIRVPADLTPKPEKVIEKATESEGEK